MPDKNEADGARTRNLRIDSPCESIVLSTLADRPDKGVYRYTHSQPTYASWSAYNSGLPLVQVRDLTIDPFSKMLIAATWGRGAWTAITGP